LLKRIAWIAALSILALMIARRLGYDVTVGTLVLEREDLERTREAGGRRSMIVVGGCVVERDVPPELVEQTVQSLTVIGGIVLDQAVLTTLGDRLKVVGAATTRPASTG
jgi:hypothetical protein